MIPSLAYTMKCPQCGYKKRVRPKSDVIAFSDMVKLCPKCKTYMEKQDESALEKLVGRLLPKF